MAKKIKIAVIIVAAGSGLRVGHKTPKQYLQVCDKTVLEHTIERFTRVQDIELIHVVIAKEHEKLFRKLPLSKGKISFSYGGKTRQESVRLGLEALKKYNPDKVLVHDAARMFISKDTISQIIEQLDKNDAVIPAKKISDTVKKIKEDKITDTVNREELVMVQTPQGFRFDKIFKLHQKYKGKNFTDDSALFEKEKLKVKYILISEDNFKITEEKDLMKAKEKLATKKQTRVGMGFDVHQFEPGDGIILCGIKVPYDKKLKGHSDADVAWHALVDAMLGAVGKGDIGELFPDTDKKWKGADSAIFLKKADEVLKKMDGKIVNIDITIIAEKPKLGNYKKLMAQNTAKILKLAETQVNVKATTTEKLGFTGRGEGIPSQAIVSILL